MKRVCAGTPAFFMLFHSLIFFFTRITHHSIDPVHIKKQNWFPFGFVELIEMVCKVRVCGFVLCSFCLCILVPNSYFIAFPEAVISYCLNEYSIFVGCEGMRKRHFSIQLSRVMAEPCRSHFHGFPRRGGLWDHPLCLWFWQSPPFLPPFLPLSSPITFEPPGWVQSHFLEEKSEIY